MKAPKYRQSGCKKSCVKSDFLHKLDLKLIKSSLLAIFCILVPLYSCDADLDGPQSLVGPGVGKVCLAVIVVVVEQGPDVRLLVGRLRIRGGHPVSVVAKDEINDQVIKSLMESKQSLTCTPPPPPWWRS